MATKNTKAATVVFNLRMPLNMREALDARAYKNYRTSAAEARLAIEKHLQTK